MSEFHFATPEAVQRLVNVGSEANNRLVLSHDEWESVVRSLAYTFNFLDCIEELDLVNEFDHESVGGCYDTCWRVRAGELFAKLAEAANVRVG